jgi:hypothetical protein
MGLAAQTPLFLERCNRSLPARPYLASRSLRKSWQSQGEIVVLRRGAMRDKACRERPLPYQKGLCLARLKTDPDKPRTSPGQRQIICTVPVQKRPAMLEGGLLAVEAVFCEPVSEGPFPV